MIIYLIVAAKKVATKSTNTIDFILEIVII